MSYWFVLCIVSPMLLESQEASLSQWSRNNVQINLSKNPWCTYVS